MMKTAIIFTLAALCVSAAQALTTAWTDTGTTNLEVGTNYAAVCLVTIDGEKSICEFNASGAKHALRITTSNQAIAATSGYNAVAGTTPVDLEANNTYVLAINAIFKGNNTYEFMFYANSSYIATTTATATTLSFWANTGLEVTGYEGNLTQEQLNYLRDNETTIVPEPTALALLALGVAGLALKRKVA